MTGNLLQCAMSSNESGAEKLIVSVSSPFTPDRDRCADIADWRLCANSRHRRLPLANKKAPTDAGTRVFERKIDQ